MWPTAELHLHIEGTLETDLLVSLARRNGVDLPSFDEAELQKRNDFSDLQSFLDLYYANLAVLKTEDDFYDLTTAYLRRASAAGVRRAELFFDPQTHLANDVPIEAIFWGISAAAADARKDLNVSADLIMCFLRDKGADAAMNTLELAMPFRDAFIGVGLDSAEVGYPPALFADVFAAARGEGLHLVAHAGEEGGPDYVREALDVLKVERIDHGNRALEDPELVARLREEQIPLTVCPLSNLALNTAPPELENHPLRRMLDEGLLVTINSDDPAYFGGYIDDNYRAIEEGLGLTPAELEQLAVNSFQAAFIPNTEKTEYIKEVRSYGAQR